MTIDPKYLELSYDQAGIRDSQKRLQVLITEVAVEPLIEHQDSLLGDLELVEAILAKRIAMVIAYWCQNKHVPVKPDPQDLMRKITNTSKSKNSDETLEEFYIDQVKDSIYTLGPILGLDIPDVYEVLTDDLEYALLELEEKIEHRASTSARSSRAGFDLPGVSFKDEEAELDLDELDDDEFEDDVEIEVEKTTVHVFNEEAEIEVEALYAEMFQDKDDETEDAEVIPEKTQAPVTAIKRAPQRERGMALTQQTQIAEHVPTEINIGVLSITAEEAWHMIYNLMGYRSEYIQEKMLPRWQQNPTIFEKDRRFLYDLFIQAIRNASGAQIIAGNFSFVDRQMSVDQLWQHYFTDLTQNVGPQLAAARIEAAANDPWHKKLWQTWSAKLRNLSPIWLLALSIALVFDGLTTYVSLDQTPMEGAMVMVFTVLITALFQIADLLVINYRKREFEADAMIAKYSAKFEQLTKVLTQLDTSSDSYVQFTMERSRAQADWKAAEDSRKMARRGRYWSARIADVNIVVTAYGFAFMFLNAEEPMSALYQQFEHIFITQTWGQINLWVFLMVGLAITVSFVINTAQRTEILGWTMNRLKNEA